MFHGISICLEDTQTRWLWNKNKISAIIRHHRREQKSYLDIQWLGWPWWKETVWDLNRALEGNETIYRKREEQFQAEGRSTSFILSQWVVQTFIKHLLCHRTALGTGYAEVNKTNSEASERPFWGLTLSRNLKDEKEPAIPRAAGRTLQRKGRTCTKL